MNYLTLPIGPGSPKLANAVIEVPLGEVNKYEHEELGGKRTEILGWRDAGETHQNFQAQAR